MSIEERKCQICGSLAETSLYEKGWRFVSCDVCGRYEYNEYTNGLSRFNRNHLSAFLAYNCYPKDDDKCRYYTTRDKAYCDDIKTKYQEGNTEEGYPIHLDCKTVENWYPKSFADKIDSFLIYLNNQSKHIGEIIELYETQVISAIFADRFDINEDHQNKREQKDILNQCEFILDYLKGREYIEYSTFNPKNRIIFRFILCPNSYSRIDDIQRKETYGRNVLVAMKFGEETRKLRESIRLGIQSAGYNPIFIDEVEHNDFITPELLKYIKDSKFVVVDLTHQNNGAYFEEGYAMGLGKPVIQLCKNGVQLHFDIAQKNTIIWESEDEITERLKKRILATID